jgi:hypothetical protein
MDVEHPLWDQYYERFLALSENALLYRAKEKPVLNACTAYLCLFGDNGYATPEAELEALGELEQMSQVPGTDLRRLEMAYDYWQETILFIP